MAQPQRKIGLLSVIQSTLAAAFGVQSSKKREQDFTEGRPGHFIIAGIAFTILFVISLMIIVNIVIE